jgi:hypothetical protein
MTLPASLSRQSVKDGFEIVQTPFALELVRTRSGREPHETHILISNAHCVSAVQINQKGNVSVYAFFLHEGFSGGCVEIVPGDLGLPRVTLEQRLERPQRRLHRAVVHIENIDSYRRRRIRRACVADQREADNNNPKNCRNL